MVLKISGFVLLALLALAIRVEAQEECVPDSVVNMRLSDRHILSWELDPDEKCFVDHFFVYIFQRDRPIEYSLEVNEFDVDVSFLEVCEEWTLVVVPVSGQTRGREHRLFAAIPLPWDADLSIAYINVTRNGVTDELHLTWDLRDTQYGSCSLRYRITIEEDGNPDIFDLYQSDRSVNLHFLSPCTPYQIGVRAINIAEPTTEGPLMSRLYEVPPSKQAAPRLESVELGVTGFNMTWELEERNRNRCEVTEFFVFGGTFFNSSILYDDKPERDHVTLTITSLSPSSMYYLRASVLNSAGWSDPTVVAIQTLDLSANKESLNESV